MTQGAYFFRSLFSIPCTAVVAGALALSACGGGGSSAASPTEPAQLQGMLKPVESEAEFLAAIEAAYTSKEDQLNRDGSIAQATPQPEGGDAALDHSSGDAASSYSTTYTQELDVDEVDVVKYNGEHLFIAPSRQNTCCYALAMPAFAEGDTAEGSDSEPVPTVESNPPAIRILATDSGAATAAEVGRIELEDGDYVQGLYLLEQQQGLLTLLTQNFYGGYGAPWLDFAPWHQQNLEIRFYDVSDPSAFSGEEKPQPMWSVELEGGFVDSRRVGNTVYLVSRHTPNLPYLYPLDQAQFEANRGAIDQGEAEDFIPALTITTGQGTSSRPLFSATDCLVTNTAVADSDSPGYRVLTSITAVTIDDPSNPQTLCYNESAAGMYMSSSALYLTDVRYSSDNSVTRIHKFALGDEKPAYRGSAEVEGYLWSGGQQDFRISEYQGRLRILTTQRTENEQDRWDHRLYVLAEAAEGQSLEQLAVLPNSQRGQPIGKDNEDIYGVRFNGDRAYVVSFERIDPLYVIDLTDAADPKIVGTLEVPGFSDFLHPIGDDLLLGLGTSSQWNGQVKLELFDISVPSEPSSQGSVLIGDPEGWSWSEAQYNRHAFSYLEGESADRFAVPVQLSGEEEGGYYQRESLYLFEINNKHDPAAASLDQAGSIEASWPENENWYGGYRHRAVIHGDAVYFISGDYVWSALWGHPGMVTPHQ